jgi:hypothetical protein
VYARHVLHVENIARDTGGDRPDFKRDDHFDYDVNFYYTQVQQTATIAQLVGSEELANQYVRVGEDVYLARGHLAPNADFVYYAYQVLFLLSGSCIGHFASSKSSRGQPNEL